MKTHKTVSYPIFGLKVLCNKKPELNKLKITKHWNKVDCFKCLQKACRLEGHPGTVFFNMNIDATEPDMTCTRCGMDLG